MFELNFRSVSLKKSTLAAAITAAITITAPQVYAQSDGDSDSPTIEVISVTSQKRVQNVQEVPITISTFVGDDLEKANIDNLNEIVMYTPGLAGQKTGTDTLESFSIRGVSTSDFGTGGDLSVGVYENGIYRPSSGGALGFYDTERVEILKGPQGLLFGRNATSGAISISTNRPSDYLEGNFSLGLSERNGVTFSGALNLPINDDFALRIAGKHDETDGYVNNLITGTTLLGSNRDEFRTSFRYTGFNNTTIDLIVDYSDIERKGGEIYSRTDTIYGPSLADIGIPFSTDPQTHHADFDGFSKGTYQGAMLEIKTELNENFSLTSLTGYRSAKYTYAEDFDSINVVASHFSSKNDSEYYSQEFRVNYNTDGFSWFAGVSGYSQDVSSDFGIDADSDNLCILFFGADCTTLESNGGVGDPGIDPILSLTNYMVANGLPTEISEFSDISGTNSGWAIFGEATYQLTDKVEVSLGARYTFDKKKYEREVQASINPLVIIGGLHGGYYTDGKLKSENDWSDISPRAAVRYALTDDVNFYATASKGYKAGGYDSFGFTNVPDIPSVLTAFGGEVVTNDSAVNSYDSEEIISYELGMKSRWLENSLQVNTSLFHYTYSDMQLIARKGNTYVVQNVGEAVGQGAEFEIRYLPSDNWDLFFGAAYTDTETELSTEENEILCGELNCNGNRLPYNPRFTSISAVNYSLPINNEQWELFATLEHTYQGKSYSSLENLPEQETESIELVNLRAGIIGEEWTLMFYIENVADKVIYSERNFGSTGAFSSAPSVPRTAGAKFSMSF